MKYKLIIVLLVGIFVLRSAEAGVATGIYDPFKKMEKVKFTYEHSGITGKNRIRRKVTSIFN
jgi:hypothetical protein